MIPISQGRVINHLIIFYQRSTPPSSLFNINLVRSLYIISTFFTPFPPKKSPDFCHFPSRTCKNCFKKQEKMFWVIAKNVFYCNIKFSLISITIVFIFIIFIIQRIYYKIYLGTYNIFLLCLQIFLSFIYIIFNTKFFTLGLELRFEKVFGNIEHFHLEPYTN